MDAKQKFLEIGYTERANTEYFLIYEKDYTRIIFDRAKQGVKKVSLDKEVPWISPKEVAAIQEQLTALGWVE
jgi:hypothetical protein